MLQLEGMLGTAALNIRLGLMRRTPRGIDPQSQWSLDGEVGTLISVNSKSPALKLGSSLKFPPYYPEHHGTIGLNVKAIVFVTPRC